MRIEQHRPLRVIQFGEGNFLRAFIDWMVQGMNDRAGFDGSVCLVKSIPGSFSPAFARQGLAYHVVTRGQDGTETVRRRERIDSISGLVNPYEDFDAYLRVAAEPTLSVIVSNTTEAGITYVDTDRAEDRPAPSYPGKLTQFLRARFLAHGGPKERAVVVLPCELIEKNGQTLKHYVLRHAERWYHDAAFTAWLERDCTWLDTLVDRIVPGHDAEERARCAIETGFDDELLVVAEPYHLFVIQSTEREDVLPLKAAGFNVVWTNELTPHRSRKVRVLNGGHTFMAMIGLGLGLRSVREALEHPLLGPALDGFYRREVVPLLPFPTPELEAYRQIIISRFANPFMVHKLADIALNSVSKYVSRILPSVTEYVARFGQVPELACFALAALVHRLLSTEGVVDGAEILAELKAIAQAHGADPEAAGRAVFASERIWGQGTVIPPVAQGRAIQLLADIRRSGLEASLARVLAGVPTGPARSGW